ncbi:MAG: putative peptidoglycan glycosyltransferase FtsW [Pseudomonadota bacterium]
MRLSRADQSLLTRWWFSVDHLQLLAILCLFAVGLIVSLSASPSVADAKELPTYYFAKRHAVFASIGLLVVLVLSLQSATETRRTALLVFALALAGLAVVHFLGSEANGAQRWLRVAGLSIQPSEIAKPAFVVLSGWAFAETRRRHDMPAFPIALAMYAVFAGFLLLQPDVGLFILISLAWGVMLFLSGISLIWLGGMAALGALALIGAFFTMPHVQQRLSQFMSSDIDARSQIGQAYQSFTQGGFFGVGPGEGTIKTSLPDAHTDFIFAVIAEEYGVAICLLLLSLYALIVLRAFLRAVAEPDLAVRFAIIGLAVLFGGQAVINMGVNVGLFPAKGMTLPLISAGGSSMLGISVTLGMLLALTRHRRSVIANIDNQTEPVMGLDQAAVNEASR